MAEIRSVMQVLYRLAGRDGLVRTPTVLQMEAVECGAACLAMVLAHYGRHVPLEEVRTECDVTRDGTKAANIVHVARAHGLRSKGYRKTPEALRTMPFPAILHWNFQHFVVLEGFAGRRARINDPALGRYYVEPAELDEAFTGVVLAFEPEAAFVRLRRQRRTLDGVRRRLRGALPVLGVALLASIVLAGAMTAVPAVTQRFFDTVVLPGSREGAGRLWLALGGLLAAGAGFTWIQQWLLRRVEYDLALRGARELFWHVLHLPMEFFTQRFAGDIAQRIQQNDRLAGILGGDLASALLNLTIAATVFVMMLRFDVVLTLVLLTLALCNAGVLRASARARAEAGRMLLQQQAKLGSVTAAGLSGIDTLKATGDEDEFYTRWSGYLARLINEEQVHALRTRSLSAATAVLLPLSVAVVLGIGSTRVAAGSMTVGTLIAFQFLAAAFFMPVAALARAGTLAQEADTQIGRLDDVLRYPRARADAPAAIESAEPLRGSVSVRDVSFGYARLAPPLLNGLTLDVPAGARVALVGATGSGKSTAVRLICGLYAPTAGTVLLDGVPREELPPARLARSIAFVDQEVLLFEGTVRSNLALRGQDLSDHVLWQCASDAGIADELRARADGLDSYIAEGGINFSGGQRQRLELARALAQDPSILVLDEATSALDAALEAQVLDALRARRITCIMVAHRLATVHDCDEILVLSGGRVVERGRHQELLAAGGAYAELVRAE